MNILKQVLDIIKNIKKKKIKKNKESQLNTKRITFKIHI